MLNFNFIKLDNLRDQNLELETQNQYDFKRLQNLSSGDMHSSTKIILGYVDKSKLVDNKLYNRFQTLARSNDIDCRIYKLGGKDTTINIDLITKLYACMGEVCERLFKIKLGKYLAEEELKNSRLKICEKEMSKASKYYKAEYLKEKYDAKFKKPICC
mmetsp:Transcript_14682/g.16398  ORF Transcript_14682/g.16398 Transcript_14682/m.16398 type:complete len:158 (-) Transcript_14682:20-493(-)